MATATIASAMNVRCLHSALAPAFEWVASIAPLRGRPILGNVLLTADPGLLSIAATNGDQSASVSIDVDVDAAGCALVSWSDLAAILKRAEGVITLAADEKSLIVSDELCRWTLSGLSSPDEFRTKLLKPPSKGGVSVGAEALRLLIKRTLFAADSKSSCYALGVCLETEGDQLLGVATDGRRIAYHACPLADRSKRGGTVPQSIVPSRAMRLLIDLPGYGDVAIKCDQFTATFEAGRASIVTQLLEHRFPTWRQPGVFCEPRPERSISFRVGELLSVMRRLAVATNECAKGVHWSIGPGAVEFRSQAEDRAAAARLQVTTAAPFELEIDLDPRLLVDWLEALDAQDSVSVDFDAKGEAVTVWRTGDGSYFGLMPLDMSKA